jgi:hypothetical protein
VVDASSKGEEIMDASMAISEQERAVVGDFVRSIIRTEAPQEVDIFDTIYEEFDDAISKTPSGHIPDEQMFSFSVADFQAYLANALLFTAIFVLVPFLKKAYEQTIEKMAEKSVDALAEKIHSVLTKLRKKDQADLEITRIDILVPINWADLAQRIKAESQRLGLSRARADELASLTVKELTDNQVLLGNMLLTVMRVPIEHPDSKRH